jgi:hypothetical protein
MAPFFAGDVVHDAQKQFQSKTDLHSQIVVRVTGKKNQRHAAHRSRRKTQHNSAELSIWPAEPLAKLCPFLLGKQKKSKSR